MVRRREALCREASEIQRATRPGSAVSDREKTGGVLAMELARSSRQSRGDLRRGVADPRQSDWQEKRIRRSENEGRRPDGLNERRRALRQGDPVSPALTEGSGAVRGRRVRSASETATRRKKRPRCLYLLFLARRPAPNAKARGEAL